MNILHKLGLYKKSEIDNLIAMTNKFVSSTDSAINKMLETQECYKVALRMFNEAQTVEHAVKVISDYCKSTICAECGFTDAGKRCKLAYTPPAWWNLLSKDYAEFGKKKG